MIAAPLTVRYDEEKRKEGREGRKEKKKKTFSFLSRFFPPPFSLSPRDYHSLVVVVLTTITREKASPSQEVLPSRNKDN